MDQAKSRGEQCDAIHRLQYYALNPDQALASVPESVQFNCRERTMEARHHEELRAQQNVCVAQCSAARSNCDSNYGAPTSSDTWLMKDCEGDFTRCVTACGGDPAQASRAPHSDVLDGD